MIENTKTARGHGRSTAPTDAKGPDGGPADNHREVTAYVKQYGES